jgi:tRNA(Ile)-lysidine synthase
VERLLVALSGGPDSTALIHLLAAARARRGPGRFPEILAGHVHHGLRGEDADLDEAFSRELARSLGIEILVHHGDARAEAARMRLSPEAAARSLRYGAFRAWARERRIDAIALAHHLDDQAETVLLRATRGTGIRGLAGIPRERRLLAGEPRTRIIRPLLEWTRKEILEYLRLGGQAHRIDASNADLSIPRNRIRNEVIPILERHVHPAASRSLASLGRAAAALARDVEVLGRRCFRAARWNVPGSGVFLEIEALGPWPRSVLDEVFRLAAARAARGAARTAEVRLPRTALDVLARWVARAPRAARHSVGGAGGERLVLEARYGLIRVRVARAAERAAPADLSPAALAPGGRARWRGWTFEVEEEGGEVSGSIVERFDAASLLSAGPLRIRGRRDGDRFHPLGAPGSKALKEFFRERRVWPSDRGGVPLLLAGDTIAWVVGHRIADPFRVRAGTVRVIAVRATPPEAET